MSVVRITLETKSLRGSFIVPILLLLTSYMGLGQTDANENKLGKKPAYPVFKPIGFLQQQFTVDNIEDNSATFSIHRARLGFKGELSKKIKVNIVVGALEPPDRSPALVNGFIDLAIHPLFNLRTGQFLVPFGLEGPEAIFLNPAIERSRPTRKLNTYRMFRDVGINMHGEYSFVSYSLSILNGTGANGLRSFNPRDVVLRVNFALTEGFMVGLSGQVGSYETESLDTFSRRRWGAHMEYYGNNQRFRFRGESVVLDRQVTGDRNEFSHGGYLLGGYKFSEKWEGIGRLEYYQPDNIPTEIDYGLTLGSNYSPTKRARLSLNGTAFTETGNFDSMNYYLTLQLQFVL